jgi:hypothetical protein
MGNASSTAPVEKKTRNLSIAEFDYLLDPSILGTPNAPSHKNFSSSPKYAAPGRDATDETLKSHSLESNAHLKGSSNKLKLLQKAKQSGSYISKKDILSFANHQDDEGQNSSFIKSGANSANASIIIQKPLREIQPPANVGDIVHPAKWLWNLPELTLCMDEHGNTYYYNYTTQESTWDPPETLSLPKSEITFRVLVPEGAVEGNVFTATINDTQVRFLVWLFVFFF